MSGDQPAAAGLRSGILGKNLKHWNPEGRGESPEAHELQTGIAPGSGVAASRSVG
jgi:hypothetical protein